LDEKTQNIYKNLEIQVDKIYKHVRQGSFKTRERYEEGTKRFCKFVAENYKMQKFGNVSDKHVKAYIDDMQSRGLSVSTVKTDLSAIRFTHDHTDNSRNVLADNSTYDLGKRNFGGVDRTWNNKEYQKMVELAREQGYQRVASAMQLARTQGLRIHEAFRMDRSNVENALRTGELATKGKGGKERTIPLTEEGRQVLKQAMHGVDRGHKLFINDGEKTHLVIKETQNWIDRNRNICKEDGRTVPMTIHGLRHSYAQEAYYNCIKQGLGDYDSRKYVSNLLGHERDDVTRIYLAGRG